MKLNVIQKTKDSLTFELIGEQHTFPALLCWALLKDKKVESAVYDVGHPLVGSPKIYLKTKGKVPKKAIEDALKIIESEMEDLKKAMAKAK